MAYIEPLYIWSAVNDRSYKPEKDLAQTYIEKKQGFLQATADSSGSLTLILSARVDRENPLPALRRKGSCA
jgi:hypothetical protein